MRKLVVALAALVVTVLVAEGVLVTFLGTSIRELVRGRPPLAGLDVAPPRGDDERFAAAERTAGPFRVPADPLVGLTFKAATEIELGAARLRTDELGLRAGAGPIAAETFHVVLLGGSAAGFAEELTALVRAAAPDADFACTAVSVPGWNGRNAVRHLLDHLDRLAPDLVVYVCAPDDADDALSVDQDGYARRAPDPAVERPLCVVAPRARDLVGLELTAAGRTRVADLAARLDGLAARLARLAPASGTGRPPRLVLAPLAPSPLARAVAARLGARGPDVPALPLLARSPADPAAPEVRHALAAHAARALADAGELPFALAASALPAVEGELAAAGPGDEAAPQPVLDARVEPAAERGLGQVYGGLDAAGRLGIECALVLPPGRALSVELAAAGDAPGLYPLAIAVTVDDAVLGTVTLSTPDASARAEFPLDAERPVEVRLTASDWTLAAADPAPLGAPVGARLVRVETHR